MKPGWTDELTDLSEQSAGFDHFIDIASRRHAMAQVKRHVSTRSPIVLEVGCSSGVMLGMLARELPHATVIGTDYIEGGLRRLARRLPSVPLARIDLARCPIADGSVDIVVALNVLEHIEDDEAAVTELFRILRPGGAAIIEVPAGSDLVDSYDRALLHFRRYDMGPLCDLFRRNGFDITVRSHMGLFLYPAFYLIKRLSQFMGRQRTATDDRSYLTLSNAITGVMSPIMNLVMRAEDALRRAVNLPIGIRCLLTTRKPIPVGS